MARLAGFMMAAWLAGVIAAPVRAQSADESWKGNWEVPEGFAMAVDTSGYHLPSSIAFVPNPGPDPKDPLYFVTELRGRLRVVTNDRTVYTFAEDFFHLKPERELPEYEGEVGLVSVCLEPEHGYVFVSYAYQDERGLLRNAVRRFDTDKPHTFALKPVRSVSFSHIFDQHLTSVSHQIGRLLIIDGVLYVGVGDGEIPHESQNLQSPLGKILRMTLDGEPLPDNPLRIDDDPTRATNYIWVYGLRNPFSLATTQGRLFVGDNGMRTDRFMEVRAGENWNWNGENWSIGAYADIVFGPAVSPVQMEYLEPDNEVFPPIWRDKFYVAFSGDANAPPGPGKHGAKCVAMIDYDLATNTARSVPTQFVRYRGEDQQVPVGLAIGPDGLYFASILDEGELGGVVFRVSYDPENEHPYVLHRDTPPLVMMHTKGCFSCHSLTATHDTMQGPSLERNGLIERIRTRLDSPQYALSVEKLRSVDEEPFRSWADRREEVMQAQGEKKVFLWTKYHLLEPRFDNPLAKMPQFRLTEAEARRLTEFLLYGDAETPQPGAIAQIRSSIGSLMPQSRTGTSAVSFALGFCAAAVCGGGFLLRRRSRRTSSPGFAPADEKS